MFHRLYVTVLGVKYAMLLYMCLCYIMQYMHQILPNGVTLQWRHNGRDSVSNHQCYDCLLNRLFRCRSKQTSKLRVTGLCAENSPETVEFPVQMASTAENFSIWWRHHEVPFTSSRSDPRFAVCTATMLKLTFYFLFTIIFFFIDSTLYINCLLV